VIDSSASSDRAPAARVQVRAFGQLTVTVDGVPVALGPPKQRLVLAVLLGRPDVEVPSDELIDALWGGEPPMSAANNLRSYVYGLRRVLGDVITGHGRPGYRLQTDQVSTDIDRFRGLCTAAEAALTRQDLRTGRDVLAEALALRRGRPFADMPRVAAIVTAVDALEERWMLGIERRIQADLDLGQAAELVSELTVLVARYPGRERLLYLLMLALYRSGRQAEALAAYRRAAAMFTEELAVSPGTEVAKLHQAMLRQDTELERPPATPRATAPVPAELPPGSGHFTGRDQELSELSEVLKRFRDQCALPIVAVVGPAGVGKTAVVTEWGRRLAQDFPDGQIFVDLRAFSREPPVPAAGALHRLLCSLGVSSERVPEDVDEAVALYRSLLVDKRTLIVLDNVASARQVTPLLPGGYGNAVVVTSRNRLTGLISSHGAHQLVLGALSTESALDLIDRIIGLDRGALEPDAARELAQRCGHLPLALRIAAADLANDPASTISAYLDRHQAGNRAATLGVPGEPYSSVKAALDRSLSALAGRQQRLLGLLGLVPGPDFTTEAVAALVDADQATVAEDLDRLAGAHLIRATADDRYAFNDLIREYARDRSSGLPADQRATALTRLCVFYRDAAGAADRMLGPGALRLPAANEPRPGVPVFAGERSAQSWLATELPNILAACRYATEHGPSRLAGHLADVLGRFLWTRQDLATWTTVAQAALRTACAADDPEAMAAAVIALARIAISRRDYPTAVTQFQAAIELARRAGWRRAEAVAIDALAALPSEPGQPRLAGADWPATRV
jgi:DNA-binding SARP family transcriptional activator